MSILQNAIDSIALGVEDYEVADSDHRRFISCTRNIFAGILLLFKHRLSELSPDDSDEVLIKQKVMPKMDLDTLIWVGEGNKTVDVQGIKERFKSLDIKVDWKRLDEINKYRNNIEHYYSAISPDLVRKMIADSFIVVVSFISNYLKEDPRDLLGAEIYDVMKEIDEVYENDKKLCKENFESLTYFSENIKEILLDSSCPECHSSLISPIEKEQVAYTCNFKCRTCDEIFTYESFVTTACEEKFVYTYDDFEDSNNCECPQCDGYFLYEDCICVVCGYKNNLICDICDTKVPSSEVICFEGRCSYCNYKWDKMMAE